MSVTQKTAHENTTPPAAREKSEKRWSLPSGKVQRRAHHDDSGNEYFIYVPETKVEHAPLLVGVHGISRNAQKLARAFASHCEKAGVVMVVPHFSKNRWKDYQRLGRSGRGPRADQALNSIVEEVGSLTGASADRFHLFGFSGGAQFAHRYLMAYPHRVVSAVVAGAGWYTWPDTKERFPYGIRASRDLKGVRLDPEEFLRVKVTAMVGEKDTSTEGLRSTKRVMHQGVNRLERAQKWVEAMRAAASTFHLDPQVSLEVIQGGNHSFKGLIEGGRLGERVFASLFGAVPAGSVSAQNG